MLPGTFVFLKCSRASSLSLKFVSLRLPILRNWKSQYIVKEGKTLNFGSHKENLGVNDSQTSTNGSPDADSCFIFKL